jgi:hypothetical protein
MLLALITLTKLVASCNTVCSISSYWIQHRLKCCLEYRLEEIGAGMLPKPPQSATPQLQTPCRGDRSHTTMMVADQLPDKIYYERLMVSCSDSC